jgi:hypothetical protein
MGHATPIANIWLAAVVRAFHTQPQSIATQMIYDYVPARVWGAGALNLLLVALQPMMIVYGYMVV